MNDRDYLRSLGFTVGERGRFGKEMLDALRERNGVVDETAKFQEFEAEGIDPHVARAPLRQAETLIGFDNRGSKIAFILCADCHNHMIWCECEAGILAPAFIVRSDNPLVRLAS